MTIKTIAVLKLTFVCPKSCSLKVTVLSLTNSMESLMMFLRMRTAVRQQLLLSCHVDDVLLCLLYRLSISVCVRLCDLLLCCKLLWHYTVNYSTLVTPTHWVVYQRSHSGFEFQGSWLMASLNYIGIVAYYRNSEVYGCLSV